MFTILVYSSQTQADRFYFTFMNAKHSPPTASFKLETKDKTK